LGRFRLLTSRTTSNILPVKILLPGLLALLLASPLAAQNSTVAYDVAPGVVGNQAIAGLGVGNDFNVIYPITISQFGVFNSGTNGIQGSAELTVQLFERNGHKGTTTEAPPIGGPPEIPIGGWPEIPIGGPPEIPISAPVEGPQQ